MTALPVEVRALVRRVARTLSWGHAWRWGARGLLVAAAASLGWTGLGTIVPTPTSPLLVLLGGVAAAVVVAMARGLVPLRDLAPAARLADAHLQLKERLSTALDLAMGRIPATALAWQVMRDAAESARDALPSARLRPAWPAGTRWAALAVALAVLSGLFVPGFTLPATPARETAARIQREGSRLTQVARRLEQTGRTERAPAARRAAPEVRTLAQQLQRERMDRTAALARIAALERQLESARRQLSQRIGEALNPRAPASLPESLFRPSTSLDQSIRQLRELSARLSQGEAEGERQDLLQQLAELSRSGEGQMPIEARRKIEEARRKTEAGNTRGGSEALREALAELEGLRALMADENALRMTERELERSSMRIARGSGDRESAEDLERGETQAVPPGPGTRRLQEQEGDLAGAPPPGRGPNEGSTPGQGKIAEKLGPQTPRLDASAQRSRVRGQEGQGQFQTSEILGPGRRQPARAPAVSLPPTVVRRADEHMERARIPADLRAVVRRYFMLLAERK